MKKTILLLSFCYASFLAFSQDFSNKGKLFYITYPAHIDATASAMGNAHTAIVSPGTFFGLPRAMDDMLSGQATRLAQPA